MPSISEAIEKFRAISFTAEQRAVATQVSMISRELESLAAIEDEKASTLRTQLIALSSNPILSEAAQDALLALCAKYPVNDVDLFKMSDEDETIFLPSGYAFGKEWLKQHISTNGYNNPFNRQKFSEQDTKIISAIIGESEQHSPHQHDERLDLTRQAIEAITAEEARPHQAERARRPALEAVNRTARTEPQLSDDNHRAFIARDRLNTLRTTNLLSVERESQLSDSERARLIQLFQHIAPGRLSVDRALQLSDEQANALATGRLSDLIVNGRLTVESALQLSSVESAILTVGNIYVYVSSGRLSPEHALQLRPGQLNFLNSLNNNGLLHYSLQTGERNVAEVLMNWERSGWQPQPGEEAYIPPPRERSFASLPLPQGGEETLGFRFRVPNPPRVSFDEFVSRVNTLPDQQRTLLADALRAAPSSEFMTGFVSTLSGQERTALTDALRATGGAAQPTTTAYQSAASPELLLETQHTPYQIARANVVRGRIEEHQRSGFIAGPGRLFAPRTAADRHLIATPVERMQTEQPRTTTAPTSAFFRPDERVSNHHIIGNLYFRIEQLTEPFAGLHVIVNGREQNFIMLSPDRLRLIIDNIGNITELKNIFTTTIRGMSAESILSSLVNAEREARLEPGAH